MAERICTYPGCTNKQQRPQGLCHTHYRRWREYGSPDVVLRMIGLSECSVDGCTGKPRSWGMCVRHYSRWLKHGDPLQATRPRGSAEERFWSKADRRGDRDCWPWLGSLDQDGYGSLRLGGTGSPTIRAHRYSWELASGEPVPGGLVIDHLCRNRACVNPAHLDPCTNHVNVVIRGLTPTSLNHRKTHCINGHEFTPENTWTYTRPGGGVHRQCKQCTRDRDARRGKVA